MLKWMPVKFLNKESGKPFLSKWEGYHSRYKLNVNVPQFMDTTLYLVDVIFTDNLLVPCIPTRDKEGNLYYVRSIVRQWIWGVELNAYRLYLDTLTIYSKINYTKGPVFNEYITNLYERRLNYKREGGRDDLVLFYKLLLNSLYGKFG